MTRPELTFTGERLHADDTLFSVDLVRHRAAYAHAIGLLPALGAQRIVELGSGTGYGTAELADAAGLVVAVDRVAPLARARASRAHFLQADLDRLPLARGAFDLAVSFQVVEHLEDPVPWTRALARLLKPTGVALVTTPNRPESDGENPYHVREYTAVELAELLRGAFEEVDVQGVFATGEARRYHEARLERIRRIVRLDPFRLRRRIPPAWTRWLFARLAIVVRRGIARRESGMPEVDLADFPIGPLGPESPKPIDLLAICRSPRAQHA